MQLGAHAGLIHVVRGIVEGGRAAPKHSGAVEQRDPPVEEHIVRLREKRRRIVLLRRRRRGRLHRTRDRVHRRGMQQPHGALERRVGQREERLRAGAHDEPLQRDAPIAEGGLAAHRARRPTDGCRRCREQLGDASEQRRRIRGIARIVGEDTTRDRGEHHEQLAQAVRELLGRRTRRAAAADRPRTRRRCMRGEQLEHCCDEIRSAEQVHPPARRAGRAARRFDYDRVEPGARIAHGRGLAYAVKVPRECTREHRCTLRERACQRWRERRRHCVQPLQVAEADVHGAQQMVRLEGSARARVHRPGQRTAHDARRRRAKLAERRMHDLERCGCMRAARLLEHLRRRQQQCLECDGRRTALRAAGRRQRVQQIVLRVHRQVLRGGRAHIRLHGALGEQAEQQLLQLGALSRREHRPLRAEALAHHDEGLQLGVAHHRAQQQLAAARKRLRPLADLE